MEATARTNPNTSSEVDGRGEVAEHDAEAERKRKHNLSQKNLLTNIRGEYIRMKKMIRDIRNVDGIEKSEERMHIAFDKEARDQIARRHMLEKKIADYEQLIRNALHQGDEE